jgi:hypothetical protein
MNKDELTTMDVADPQLMSSYSKYNWEMGCAVDLGFPVTDFLDLMHKLVSNFKILWVGERLDGDRIWGRRGTSAWEKIGGSRQRWWLSLISAFPLHQSVIFFFSLKCGYKT